MPKNTSASTTSNSYSLRSKGNIDKADIPSSQSIKRKRAANRKQIKSTMPKPFVSLDDDFTIPEQIAKEWIARDSAPACESPIHFIAEDPITVEQTEEEQKTIEALALQAIQYNQHSHFFQMLEYKNRQNHLQASLDELTDRLNKLDQTLKQIHKDHLSSSLGFFSHSPSLADMEPRLSEDLDGPNNFSLSSNEIWRE